jgi:hypothetical protein
MARTVNAGGEVTVVIATNGEMGFPTLMIDRGRSVGEDAVSMCTVQQHS